MTPEDVRAAAKRLPVFHQRFAPLFGKDEAQNHAQTYVKGLMVCPERKSVEPIALHVGTGNVSALGDLGRGLGPLAARALGLGVLGFGAGVVATFSLPHRRQPAADLPLAFRVLAVAPVPTPRVVLASAPFVQAVPRARAAPSGLGTALSFNVVVAHGRLDLPRESSGRMRQHSPRALSKREQNEGLLV